MEKYLKNNSETGLEIGNKYTMMGVSNLMAMTFKREITITDIQKIDEYAQYSNIYKLIFREKGKRKPRGIFISTGMIFIKGWNTELKVDTEFSSFSGNALINLVGESKKCKEIIERDNAFKHTDKGRITYTENEFGNKKMLYPEQADQEHAVVRRIMKND